MNGEANRTCVVCGAQFEAPPPGPGDDLCEGCVGAEVDLQADALERLIAKKRELDALQAELDALRAEVNRLAEIVAGFDGGGE